MYTTSTVLCCLLKYSHFQSSLEFVCLVKDATHLGWDLHPYCTLPHTWVGICACIVPYSSKTMYSITFFNFWTEDKYLKIKHKHEY